MSEVVARPQPGQKGWADEIRDRVAEAVRAAFLAGCRELFEVYSGLESFGWQQHLHELPDGELDYDIHREDPEINGLDGCDKDGGWSTEEDAL